MEQFVFLPIFVAVIMVSFPPVQGSTEPGFELIEKNEDFEVRKYGDTEWITTNLKALTETDVMAAHSTLKQYSQKHGLEGLFKNAWPVIITGTEDGSHLTLSWFAPPRDRMLNDDGLVKVETKAAATVYVKVFWGIPDVETSKKVTAKFQSTLEQTGKSYDRHTYTWCIYHYTFSNKDEVWIYADH